MHCFIAAIEERIAFLPRRLLTSPVFIFTQRKINAQRIIAFRIENYHWQYVLSHRKRRVCIFTD